ncbi:hypothetical protein ES703_83551 [subsurface metagenome]
MEHEFPSGHPSDDVYTVLLAVFDVYDFPDVLGIPERRSRPFPSVKPEIGLWLIAQGAEKKFIHSHVQGTWKRLFI